MTFLTDGASFSVRQYKIEKKKAPMEKFNNCHLLEVFKIIFMSNRSWGRGRSSAKSYFGERGLTACPPHRPNRVLFCGDIFLQRASQVAQW